MMDRRPGQRLVGIARFEETRMATNVGRLTIGSIVALIAIVVIALMLANR
jgi:hypothetical protein